METLLESNFSFFCICQEYIIDKQIVNEIVDLMFKDVREIGKEINKNVLVKCASPRLQEKIMVDNFEIEYFIHYLPSDESLKLYLNDILQDKKDDFKEDMIKNVRNELVKFVKDRGFVHNFKEDQFKFSLRVMSGNNKTFNVKDMIKLWKTENILNIVELMKEYDLVSHDGLMCPYIQLDKKYKMIGNIIPRNLPLPIEIEENVGKTNINGIKLEFENSPIGLHEIYINKISEGLEFRIKTQIIINDFKESPNDVFEYSNKILSFFVEVGDE